MPTSLYPPNGHGVTFNQQSQSNMDAAHNSEPASEQDADGDADEDMSYAGPYHPPQPTLNPPRAEKINFQAVDPVLYGLRRSVSDAD